MKLTQVPNSSGDRPNIKPIRLAPAARAGCASRDGATLHFWTRDAAIGLLAGIALLFTPAAIHAQSGIPAAINYQGRLTDNQAMPVPSGYYEVGFRIWGNATQDASGNYLWGRTFPLNVVSNGMFNVLLTDDGSPLTTPDNPAVPSLLEAFDGPNRFLSLTVSRNPQGQITSPVEITPRQQLVSAPFAIHAYDATQADRAGFATNATEAVYAASAGSSQFSASNGLQLNGLSTLDGNITLKGEVTLPGSGSTTNGGFVPVGGIIMWSGTKVPDGWALCSGGTYNGNAIPDLRGRFVLGSGTGAGLTPRAISDPPGGAESHTLSLNEMPSHAHSRTTHTVGYSAMWDNGTQTATAAPNQSKNMGSQTYSTDPAGGGNSFNMMPPYYVLAFIIRIQ